LLIGGGLLAIAVATAALLAVRSPASFEPDSPEAAVQGYLQAVLAGDNRAATEFLSQESACSRDDFRFRDRALNVRVTLLRTDETPDEAIVDVRIRFDETSLDALSSYDIDETFTLVPEAGEWRIAGAPWPLFFCDEPAS